MSKAVQTRTFSAPVEATLFTVAEAKKGFADPVQATKDVRALKDSADRVAGAVMWNAALVVFDALGESKDRVIGDAAPFKDQTDYIVRGLGFSKGYGTTLKRLGRAAVVHGVRQGSAEWAFLASNAQRAAVGAAIALDDTAEFKRLIKGYAAEMREHGEIKGAARTPQVGDGTDKGDGDKGDGSTPAESAPREATLDDVLNALDAMLKQADRETFAAAESRIQRMLEREITIRSKQTA
jgi:hypothetical protein